MDPTEVIEAALAGELVDEDGDEIELELLPPATAEEIAAAEAEAGAPLPAELRALLGRTRAIEGAVAADLIDFTGRDSSFEMREVFPHGLPFAGDGFGNFWVADLLPGEHERAQVFFASHDPPVIVFQSASVTEFLREALTAAPDVELREQPELTREDALAAGGDLAASAESLGDEFVFFDLRDAQPGTGFEWGRNGPETRVVRAGTERIWAVRQRQTRGLRGLPG